MLAWHCHGNILLNLALLLLRMYVSYIYRSNNSLPSETPVPLSSASWYMLSGCILPLNAEKDIRNAFDYNN